MHTNITVKKLPLSEVEISGEIPYEAFTRHRKEALKRIGAGVTMPGFRSGHIPEKVLEKQVGEKAVLEEMAEIAISNVYPNILAEHKLFPLSRPTVTLTKLAPVNPLGFTIRIAVMPEVKLSDYKKIATTENKKPEEKITVSEKEVEDFIMTIRKSHVDHSKHDHNISKEEHDKQLEKEAPELTEEFIKKLGEFKDVADFTEKAKENLTKEKEFKAHEKKRLRIIDAIISESDIDVPSVLIESELNKITEQFKTDLARMGATIEDYLKQIKKTEAEIRKDWTPDAVKRVKLQLILNKIATDEKLEVPKEEIEKEVSHITSHYKEADPQRARDYAETVLTNEKVFQFLESR